MAKKRLNTGRKGGVAEAASRIDRENRYLKISHVFGTKLSQGSSRQETEARYDEVARVPIEKNDIQWADKGAHRKKNKHRRRHVPYVRVQKL